MAEPLKNFYDEKLVRRIAEMISRAHASFPVARFVTEATRGLAKYELMGRAKHISSALARALPPDYPAGIAILMASLEPERAAGESREGESNMAGFLYMPHSMYVAEHGLEHFELSMRAQYELTKRFTAEFSIRPFLVRYPEAALALLRTWATDESRHVRRLVSEGTRPRLPWASRLPQFQRDPKPVLELLELLKDDPEAYVRRSVANNLNDIGKDHPAVLFSVCKRWMKGATPEREWVVRHALRSAVKRGESEALSILGFGQKARVALKAELSNKRLRIGEKLTVRVAVTNLGRNLQRIVLDLMVHYVKANGRSAPKVFKLKELELGRGERAVVQKVIWFKQLTTRRHYPGVHRLDALVNGEVMPLSRVTVLE